MKRRWGILLVVAVFVLLVGLGCGLSGLPQALNLDDARTAVDDALSEAEPTPTPQRVAPLITSDTLASLQDALGAIYEEVSPSVVYIQAVDGSSSGSGFVWDRKGHIVTNNHVVAGADEVRLTFSDGLVAQATVVGTDADSDLAVLEVDVNAERLVPVRMADSAQVVVGQLAVAIGNPFGLENTMTVGFISAIGRSLPVASGLGGPSYAIPDVIQTDAPINPGNSGGVLVNDRGEVVGVTTAIVSPVQASVGIGFAVPAAIVEQVVPALIEEGVYQYPWLGISGTSLTPELAEAMGLDADQRGALVGTVTEGGPADEAGLQAGGRTVSINGTEMAVGGDVIVVIEGQQVLGFDDVVAYLVRYTRPGDEIELTVLQDGRERHVMVTLGVRPETEARSEVVRAPESELPDVAPVGRAWLGILGLSMTPEIAEAMNLPDGQEGVLVQEVVSGGPADEAGLQAGEDTVQIEGERILIGGDVIVAYDGDPVADMEELQARLSDAEPDDEVTLTVLRDGREREISVTLDGRPRSIE